MEWADIQGWGSNKELDWLFEKSQQMDSILELGSWKGRSTQAFAKGCKGSVICVDHFLGNSNERGPSGAHAEASINDIYFELVTNMQPYKNISILRMESLQAAKYFKPASIDMIFIDAGHLYEEVKQDILAWFPICRKLFCGHDYTMQEVKEAVDDILKKNSSFFVTEAIWSLQL